GAYDMAYDGAHGRVVLFGGNGANGDLGDTWLLSTSGGACATGADCGSGFCVDAVCCEVASCGTCEACDGAKPGVCGAVLSAADPDTCTNGQACDATGACKPALGAPCTAGGECASGICTEG